MTRLKKSDGKTQAEEDQIQLGSSRPADGIPNTSEPSKAQPDGSGVGSAPKRPASAGPETPTPSKRERKDKGEIDTMTGDDVRALLHEAKDEISSSQQYENVLRALSCGIAYIRSADSLFQRQVGTIDAKDKALGDKDLHIKRVTTINNSVREKHNALAVNHETVKMQNAQLNHQLQMQTVDINHMRVLQAGGMVLPTVTFAGVDPVEHATLASGYNRLKHMLDDYKVNPEAAVFAHKAKIDEENEAEAKSQQDYKKALDAEKIVFEDEKKEFEDEKKKFEDEKRAFEVDKKVMARDKDKARAAANRQGVSDLSSDGTHDTKEVIDLVSNDDSHAAS